MVQKGDSLYSIAQKFNTTVDNLKSINNLVTDSLAIGQILKIPTSTEQVQDNVYIVQKGDSLYSIASKFKTTVDKIKSLNNLSSNLLSVGQKLIIPTMDVNEPKETNTNTYVVQKGDSLYSIAQKFNTTVDNLKLINNLNSNILSIGQILNIPSSNNANNTYTVKSGDTLYSIAREFNTSVNALIELNNLTTNTLTIGQKLLLP